MITISLIPREIAAVIAGLRLVQRELPRSEFLPQGVHDIFDDGGTLKPLSEDDIDTLCEEINCAKAGLSYIEDGETITLSPAQHKLAAIRARINGVWDHPALVHYGPMTANTNADISVILNS
jgi:hypothetical protein